MLATLKATVTSTMQVKKAGVVFYEMAITPQHVDDGFAIGAHSPTGSRFKLLLFEQAGDGQWELLVQAWTCPPEQHLVSCMGWLPKQSEHTVV